MNDKTKKTEKEATAKEGVLRAAREYLERSGTDGERRKPGRTPREERPRVRDARAAAAVIEGRA